jgi:hypothetical protein
MSFNGSPQIDPASKYSEKSGRRMNDILNQESGFICRAEIPDKGCDFNVELILEDSNSSSWTFPIQLKSIQKLNILTNEPLISLPFETSRLGYLMKRIPAMGLIVFYSVEEDKCFYDFADKIYDRLIEERGSVDWMENDMVNIHIPYKNILSSESAKEIHRVITLRYEQATKMQNTNGKKYGLPTVSFTDGSEFDFNNIEHIKRFLRENGTMMIDNYDLDIIFRMISQIPHFEIYADKDFSVIAAVSYSESGLYSESETFCKKLSKQVLKENELLLLNFVKLKNSLALGYIDDSKFLEEIQKLNNNSTNFQNKITLDINVIRYQLINQKPLSEIEPSILSNILSIFSDIDNHIPNQRINGLLKLWNCENLSYLLSNEFSGKMYRSQVSDALGAENSNKSWTEEVLPLMALELRLNRYIVEVNKIATKENDKFLKAHSLSLSIKNFINHQINIIQFSIPKSESKTENLELRVQFAAEAFKLFGELNLYKEAYNSLCDLIEIVELQELAYNSKSSQKKVDLYSVKSNMETHFELEARKIIFPDLIAQKLEESQRPKVNGMPILKDLTDNQLAFVAKSILNTLNLPEDRLKYILSELAAYRMFHQRCSDPNINILHEKNNDSLSNNMYSQPVRFVLESKLSGIRTSPSSNMNELLTAWKF